MCFSVLGKKTWLGVTCVHSARVLNSLSHSGTSHVVASGVTNGGELEKPE